MLYKRNVQGAKGFRERRNMDMKKTLTFILCLVLMMTAASGALAQVQAGDSYWFGTYDQEYPGQSIEWEVLSVSNGTAVLLSRKVLECRPYDSRNRSDWASSELCSWLNGQFLLNAFSRSERQLMLSDSQGNSVFIPTLQDMTNENYGFFGQRKVADPSRSAYGTSHASMNGLWTNRYGLCSFYTRTAENSSDLYQICTNGSVGVARADRDNVGVRVMIYVKVD